MSSTPPKGLASGPDGKVRCFWGGGDDLYRRYHDVEWGMPVRDDARLFEKICLEGFQSGLSWLTILRKRENFRRAFQSFDFRKVALFDARDVRRLLADAGIVRHRGKIESTINNAKRALEIVDEFSSLTRYFETFRPPPSQRPKQVTWTVLRTLSKTPASDALSKDLKTRGFTFVGPTTVYAFMQAMGLVNDHIEGCHVRERCDVAQRRHVRVSARRDGPPRNR